MATEARSTFNNNYVPGLFTAARTKFKAHDPVWKEIYSVRSSSDGYEEGSFKSGYGYLMEKPEGVAPVTDARIQGFLKRWNNKTYALASRITEEAIEDDRYNDIAQAGPDLGRSAAATIHLLATRLLMNAAATTYHTAGDGLAICVSNHVRLDGSTWSNVGSAAAPTTSSVENAIKDFESIKDDRGMPYMQKAKAIVCGPALEMSISKIIESQLIAGSANNDLNVIRTRRSLKLIVDPYITDNRWFIQGDKDPLVGLIHYDRVKPTIKKHGDPDNGDSVFVVRARFSNEANDPRQIYMIPSV